MVWKDLITKEQRANCIFRTITQWKQWLRLANPGRKKIYHRHCRNGSSHQIENQCNRLYLKVFLKMNKGGSNMTKFYFVGNIDGVVLADAPGVYDHEGANASLEKMNSDIRFGPTLKHEHGRYSELNRGGQITGLYSSRGQHPSGAPTLDQAIGI